MAAAATLDASYTTGIGGPRSADEAVGWAVDVWLDGDGQWVPGLVNRAVPQAGGGKVAVQLVDGRNVLVVFGSDQVRFNRRVPAARARAGRGGEDVVGAIVDDMAAQKQWLQQFDEDDEFAPSASASGHATAQQPQQQQPAYASYTYTAGGVGVPGGTLDFGAATSPPDSAKRPSLQGSPPRYGADAAGELQANEAAAGGAAAAVDAIMIAPGQGIINGSVLAARRLSHTKAGTPPQAVVKISFVAPGPGSMVLRRKTALHETGVAAPSNRPTWDAAVEQQFKLAVSPPIDPSTGAENWGTLQGDLLFQLLHVKGGKRKLMSQALVPLSTLVTSGSGTQRVLDTWLTLLSRLPVPQPAGSRRRRQDSVADAGRPMGQLHVQLQLVLPGETLESDVSDASDQDRMTPRPAMAAPVVERNAAAVAANKPDARSRARAAAYHGAMPPATRATAGAVRPRGAGAHSSKSKQQKRTKKKKSGKASSSSSSSSVLHRGGHAAALRRKKQLELEAANAAAAARLAEKAVREARTKAKEKQRAARQRGHVSSAAINRRREAARIAAANDKSKGRMPVTKKPKGGPTRASTRAARRERAAKAAVSKHRAALQERITQLRMEVSAARQAVSTSGTAAQRAEAHGDKLARELATVSKMKGSVTATRRRVPPKSGSGWKSDLGVLLDTPGMDEGGGRSRAPQGPTEDELVRIEELQQQAAQLHSVYSRMARQRSGQLSGEQQVRDAIDAATQRLQEVRAVLARVGGGSDSKDGSDDAEELKAVQAEVLSTRAGIMAMERQLAKVEQRQAKTKAASDAQVASLRDELAAQREQALAVQKELRGVTSEYDELVARHPVADLRAETQLLQHELLTLGRSRRSLAAVNASVSASAAAFDARLGAMDADFERVTGMTPDTAAATTARAGGQGR